MEKFTFSANLVQAIFAYMDTRPHGEVRRLIDAMQQEIQAQIKESGNPEGPLSDKIVS